MSWDNIFLLANYWAFAGWIALAFLPRGPKILAAILYAGVFLLCLAYTVLIVGFLTGGIDPGGASGADFTTNSDERRVGKEGVSTFSSGVWPYHTKKKTQSTAAQIN